MPPSPTSDPGDRQLPPGHAGDPPGRGPCSPQLLPTVMRAWGSALRLACAPLPSRSPGGPCRKGRPAPDQRSHGHDAASAEQPWEWSARVRRRKPQRGVPLGWPASPDTRLRLLPSDTGSGAHSLQVNTDGRKHSVPHVCTVQRLPIVMWYKPLMLSYVCVHVCGFVKQIRARAIPSRSM